MTTGWKSASAVRCVPPLALRMRSGWSHPFIERLIGSCRREFTDHILFWSESDLVAKLLVFQEYFNPYSVHYSHAGKTPVEMDGKRHLATLDVKNFKWKSVCGGMYHTPIAV